MKARCPQEQLHRGLSQVARAVASRTSLPALTNVLLTTDAGRLRIVATDLSIAITTWVDAQVIEEGRAAVDARLLTDFVGTLPNEELELVGDPVRQRLDVRCGRDHAELNGIDPDDYPPIPTVTEDAEVATIDPVLLREMIGQVEFAAATDDSRPVLAGMLLRFSDQGLTIAAADGYRLAVRRGDLESMMAHPLDVIVPARAMRELARLLADAEGMVSLMVTPNQGQIIARFGTVEFLSRLIDGTFPDYRQIIPQEFSTTVELGRDALLTAVKRSSYFARDNNDSVRLFIQPSEDELEPGTVEISAVANERGTSQSFVDAVITGPEMHVGFNARYLTDVLGVLDDGRAMIGLNGSNQAGVIRSVDHEDYTHVIMPMVIGVN